MNKGKSLDLIFVCSAITFNILVSIVYIATKLENMVLLQTSGAIVLSLIFPFIITLLGYMKEKAGKRIIISNLLILSYLVLELLLDYILKIPFREIPAIHAPYIMVFYAAEFSMIGVSFKINRKAGFMVILTFCILLGCLIYLYMG